MPLHNAATASMYSPASMYTSGFQCDGKLRTGRDNQYMVPCTSKISLSSFYGSANRRGWTLTRDGRAYCVWCTTEQNPSPDAPVVKARPVGRLDANEPDGPYVDPGLYRLAEIGTLDTGKQDAFNITAVWRDTETGAIVTAHHTGCGCYTPFGKTRRPDMTPVWNLARFAKQLAEQHPDVSQDTRQPLVNAVRDALLKEPK